MEFSNRLPSCDLRHFHNNTSLQKSKKGSTTLLAFDVRFPMFDLSHRNPGLLDGIRARIEIQSHQRLDIFAQPDVPKPHRVAVELDL